MDDVFVELIVPKKPSSADTLKKVGLIAAVVLVGAAGLLFIPLLLIVAVILIFVVSWLWKRFNVEYEYSYCNGEIDIAKVFSKQSRKEVTKIQLEDIECIAPLGSHELDSYGNTFKTVDYSANDPDIKPYVIVKGGTASSKILVQLNDKMLSDLSRRMPRKVFQY